MNGGGVGYSALQGIDQGRGELDSFVGFLPQGIVGIDAVIQAHQDALGFGHGHRRDKVAVAGNQDGFLDQMFGRQQDQVDAQEDVDLFLLEARPALRVCPQGGQAAQPYGVTGQAIEGGKEVAAYGVSGALLLRWRAALIGQGVVLVGAEQVGLSGQGCGEFLIVDADAGKLLAEDVFHISAVEENCCSLSQITAGKGQGKRQGGAALPLPGM